MTHEQILETAREILFAPTCNAEIGCSCCNPDDVGMFEYLDGAIGELIAAERRKAVADYREDGIDYLGR